MVYWRNKNMSVWLVFYGRNHEWLKRGIVGRIKCQQKSFIKEGVVDLFFVGEGMVYVFIKEETKGRNGHSRQITGKVKRNDTVYLMETTELRTWEIKIMREVSTRKFPGKGTEWYFGAQISYHINSQTLKVFSWQTTAILDSSCLLN